MLEANRLWFYSLIASISKAGLDLWNLRAGEEEAEVPQSKKGKKKSTEVIVKGESRGEMLKRRLVADCFDLMIPGHATGWIPSSLAIVGESNCLILVKEELTCYYLGFASAISTVLSSRDIWDRLQ